MKKTTLFILFVSISIFTFAQKKPKIKGDKNVTTITKVLTEEFNAIEIDDALEVVINQSENNA